MYTTPMNIYMYIGSTFTLIFTLIWVYTLGLTLYLKAEAYIHGRPAVRTEYLRLLLEAFTQGTPSLYTDDRRAYQAADLDYTRALTGDNVAGIIFLGLGIIIGTLLLWPISLIVLGLRGLRRYNTDEDFHKLFEREVKPAPQPRDPWKPPPVPKQKKEFKLKV